MTNIIPTHSPNAITPPDDRFEALIADALKRLRSSRSRRKYRGVYIQWRDWCAERGIDPHALTVEYVEAFLLARVHTQSTVNWMLSALRTLLAAAVLRYPEEPLFERLHNRLRLARVHVEDRIPDSEDDPDTIEESRHRRSNKALRGDDVYRVLAVWEGERLLHRRNRALLAVLFYTGIRRAEAADLLWKDVDLESGVIHVAHGKGDKARTVPVLGDLAIEALRDLREMLSQVRFVFPSLRRGDHPNTWPITGDTVWRIVKETSERSGVDFKPHDARRTVITGILDNGGTVKEAQAVAGHAAASTTMVYAQAADAKALRDKLKTGY